VFSDGYWYVAQPYSHENIDVQRARYELSITMSKHLMFDHNLSVFTPIIQTHPIYEKFINELDNKFEQWQKYDETMLKNAEGFIILKMDGWKESKGVYSEYRLASAIGLPMLTVDLKIENHHIKDYTLKWHMEGIAWENI